MGLLWKICAPLGLAALLAIGALLILAGHTFSGLSLLASAAPLEWMGGFVTPRASAPALDEPPPLAILASLAVAAACFIAALATQR